MSDQKDAASVVDTARSTAAVDKLSQGEATTPPTFGIEVSPTKVLDKKTQTEQDAFVIKIMPRLFLRDLASWMKQYQVGKTLGEWAKQVKWKEQVWQPLKDWFKAVKWRDEVWKPMKEGMDEVDWKDVRKEVKQGMKEVDWEKVRKEVKQVDWKELRHQVNEATQDVDWEEVRKGVKEGLQEVDWKEVHREVKECQEGIGWQEIKHDMQEHLTQVVDLSKEIQDEIAPDVDWKYIKQQVIEACLDKVDAEEGRNSVSASLKPASKDGKTTSGGDG